MKRKGLQGLTTQLKEHLIHQALERRTRKFEAEAADRDARPDTATGIRIPREQPVPERCYRFDLHPGYQKIHIIREGAAKLKISDPYFRPQEGISGRSTWIEGRELSNFSGYNYLGLSGDPRVSEAAKQAIDRYGTSVSASRLVSGERPVHAELEKALARCLGVEDCVVFVSGQATNVSTIGHLFGPRDLILHDALIHNSVLQGIQLSGARRLSFGHNDWSALDKLLSSHRSQHEQVLVVIEGLYSMDGDFPDLPRFIELKQRHRAYLMVDEAHSLGVLGAHGLGIREQFGVAGPDVDIWMGTLSKALASCGGYIAGSKALIDNLKFGAPGFVYSVGMPAASAAAALAALRILEAEPERVARLQANGRLFLELAQRHGIDTGRSTGHAIVPAITGSSIKAARLAHALFKCGINVAPILYPAVEEQAARLRFFLSAEHEPEDISQAVRTLAAEFQLLG